MVGNALLVKPVVEEQKTTAGVFFPRAGKLLVQGDTLGRCATSICSVSDSTVGLNFEPGTRWYDVDSLLEVQLDDASAAAGTVVTVDAPIDKIPVFQRGGTIVPRKMRTRRSSKLMKYVWCISFQLSRSE